MNPEQLQSNENPKAQNSKTDAFLAQLDESRIVQLMAGRRQLLESLKSEISRKLYYKIEEKLANEEKTLREIWDWQQGKHKFFAKYTLILDPRYFEQEFINWQD